VISSKRVKRVFRASCALLKPAKCHRSIAAASRTTSPSAVVHSAARWSRSSRPCIAAKIASPAQNDGSSGVIGDCSVAKKSVMSGSDSTRSSCSGWIIRSSTTRLPANSSPMIMRMSRARRAGKMLTSSSVIDVPMATGTMTNGVTAATAIA
jgi:hypothetical protein